MRNLSLINAKQLSEKLGVKEAWIYKATTRHGVHRMPHYRSGKKMFFDFTEVKIWFEKRFPNGVEENPRKSPSVKSKSHSDFDAVLNALKDVKEEVKRMSRRTRIILDLLAERKRVGVKVDHDNGTVEEFQTA